MALALAAASTASLSAQVGARQDARPAPFRVREVYGVELNILETRHEIEIVPTVHSRPRGGESVVDFQYGFSRRFSLETEIPVAFRGRALSRVELEATFCPVFSDRRRLALVVGADLEAPLRSGLETEVEVFAGMAKGFGSWMLLSKLSWSPAETPSQAAEAEPSGPSLAAGPYFDAGRLLVGVPSAILRAADGRAAFRTGLDLGLQLTEELRIFVLGEATFARATTGDVTAGFFFEIE